MKKTTGLSIAAIIASGLVLPVVGSAATPSHIDDAAVRVSYADLNINNAAGAEVLYTRLQRASQEVCGIGSGLDVRSLSETRKARVCYEKALTAAVNRIDSDVLTELHNG